MLAISKYDAKTRLYQSNYIQLFIWLYNNIENLLSFLKIYKYIKFHFDLIIKNYSFWDKSNTNIDSSSTFCDGQPYWRSTTVSREVYKAGHLGSSHYLLSEWFQFNTSEKRSVTSHHVWRRCRSCPCQEWPTQSGPYGPPND